MSSAGCGPAPYTDADTATQHLSSITETEMIYYFEQCTEPTDDFTTNNTIDVNIGDCIMISILTSASIRRTIPMAGIVSGSKGCPGIYPQLRC